ncbi:MAG TPA: hypothetical protein VN524_14120 [Hyphomicrobiaceae bacterium]|jgi:anti-sigma factor RsiW|nr:hypothetical protein [Hyphomicrobiaceae bacterium]
MQCRDAEEALSAAIGGEDAGERHRAATEHVTGCPRCMALANEYRRIGESLRAVAYASAPASLDERIRAAIAAEGRSPHGRWQLADARSWVLQRDVLAAHVRSLLQDAPIQIASSERHVVRPWFNGRVEFAPAVKDLAAQNFALLGGRVDWIDGRRVAALVYKRRLHIINVFLWPSEGQADGAPHATGFKGYNAISWTAGGMTHWAVSDLNAKELAELQAMF